MAVADCRRVRLASHAAGGPVNAMTNTGTRDVTTARPAASNGGQALPVLAYDPDGRDRRILKAYVQLLDDGKDGTHAQLATVLSCTRQAVSKRFAKPGFREWLSSQLEVHLREERGPILTAFARAARRGSVQHLDAPGARPVQINILVPRP
jgi:hypothetical protein